MLAASQRPIQIKRFEALACVGALLAQIPSIIVQDFSIWDVVVGIALLTSVIMTSRFRISIGRIAWSIMMIIFAIIVTVGLVYIVNNNVKLPHFSGLDILLSVAVMVCNVAAAIYLWSAAASRWLARVGE